LDNRDILIREFFDESPITVVDRLVFTEMVNLLKRFHTSPTIQTAIKNKSEFLVSEFGEIVGKVEDIVNSADLSQYCELAVDGWLKNIRSCGYSKIDISIAESIKDIMNGNLADMPQKPTLTHGDIKIGNFLRMKQSLELLLLDFENVYSFLPEYDFITLLFSREMDARPQNIPCLLGRQQMIDILLENYYENSISRAQLEKRINFLVCYTCLRRWNFAIGNQLPSLVKRVTNFATEVVEGNLWR
jgi:thiamine kinase-like enzyme